MIRFKFLMKHLTIFFTSSPTNIMILHLGVKIVLLHNLKFGSVVIQFGNSFWRLFLVFGKICMFGHDWILIFFPN